MLKYGFDERTQLMKNADRQSCAMWCLIVYSLTELIDADKLIAC